jgi:hypothetical protein
MLGDATSTILAHAGHTLALTPFWVIALGYGLLGVGPILVSRLFERQGEETRIGVTSVFFFLWPASFLAGAIVVLAPLLLGMSDEIAFEFADKLTNEDSAIIGGTALALLAVIAFNPGLGPFIGLCAFLQGAVLLGLVASLATDGAAQVVPDWPVMAALLVGGALASYVPGLIVARVGSAAVGDDRGDIVDAGKLAASFFAVFPLTLYGGWINMANGYS